MPCQLSDGWLEQGFGVAVSLENFFSGHTQMVATLLLADTNQITKAELLQFGPAGGN